MSVEEAIAHLKRNTDSKLKPAMKVLLKTHTSPQQRAAIVECLTAWSTARTEHAEIVNHSAKLITYLRMFAETMPDSDAVTRLLVRAVRINVLHCVLFSYVTNKPLSLVWFGEGSRCPGVRTVSAL